MSDNLPPIPAFGWSCLCTKCGNTWSVDKPQKTVDCQCGYSAFIIENQNPTVEQMQDYARSALAQAQICVPAGRVTDLGFRWDGEKQHHVPQLVIEFEPVPANSPCDAKGWADRDRAAKLFSAAPQPVAQS